MSEFINLPTEAVARQEDASLIPEGVDESEEMRIHMARKLNLLEGASWKEISSAEDKRNRIESAKVLGLNEDATWDQILKAEEGQGDRVSSALLLGLPRDASYGEISAERLKREQELLKKVAEEIKFNRARKIK